MPFAIDHLMTVVTDRAAAVAALERMGFTLSAKGEHPGRGTSNNLMFFGAQYWELLSVDEPTPANQPLRVLLADGAGLLGCALATVDIEGDLARARAVGITHEPVVDIARPLDPVGAGSVGRFRLAILHVPIAAHAYLFFCQHLTPELVWPRAPTAHPNGATAIKRLFVTGESVAQAQEAFSGLLASGGVGAPEIVLLSHAQHRVLFRNSPIVRPSAPRLTGLEFEVADLAGCRALLQQRGVPFQIYGGQIYIADPALGGQPILFAERVPPS